MKKGSREMYHKLANMLFLVALMATALVFTGCEEEEIAAAPPAEQVDLSQTEDLFSEPVQPNPLSVDPDAVVVRVNGSEITRGDIQNVLEIAMKQMGGQVPPQQLQQMKEQMYQRVRDELITKKLLDAAVASAGITVSEEDVAAALEEIHAGMPPGQDLESALSAAGTTLEELKVNLKEQIATSKLIESKSGDIIEATDAEVEEYYNTNPDLFKRPESVTASHILLQTEEADSDELKAEKKATLEKLRADIIAGTISFEDAASANSDCPSKAQGGSLGSFTKGQMVPEFELAAFTQEINEVGDIVDTQFGYHIIKVTEHAEAGVVSFDEIKDRIKGFLDNQKQQKTVTDYIQSLRDGATIEIVE